MQARFAHAARGNKSPWLGSLVLVVACSGSEGIDFFEPHDEVGGGTTGGSSGASVGGSPSGGSSGDGATGGTSGDSSGGTGAEPTGGTAGETGGTGTQGGTGADAGMGGAGGKGGDAGSPPGGTTNGGMGGAGTGGNGMGGAGTGGAGTAGVGMGGAGTGGAGMGGAGMGGAGKGGTGGSAGCTPTMPATERCDGVDNNCAGGVDEGSTCPANCTGATRAGHWYIFCSFENAPGMGTRVRSWTEAQDFCTQRNLGLVFIESAEENAFIVSWITRMMLESQVWMGANDRDPSLGLGNEGTWVWGSANNAVEFWDGDENGNPVMNRYNDWAMGEPNNQGNEDCGVLSAQHNYHWDDRLCTNEYENFVCESTGATSVGP